MRRHTRARYAGTARVASLEQLSQVSQGVSCLVRCFASGRLYSQMVLLCQRTELTERPRPLCPRTVVTRQRGRGSVCVSVFLYFEPVCTSTLPMSQSAAEQGLANSTGLAFRPFHVFILRLIFLPISVYTDVLLRWLGLGSSS